MADTDYTVRTPAEIHQIAIEVRENANDLRMMEVLGNFVYGSGRLPESGDSGPDAWNMYRKPTIESRHFIIEEYEQKYNVIAGTEFNHIPALIDKFATNTSGYEEMLATLDKVQTCFGNDGANLAQSEVNTVANHGMLTRWEGDFAYEFTDLVAQMPAVQDRQRYVLGEVNAATRAHKELAERTNAAIYDIGAATRDALVAAIHARPVPHDGAIGWKLLGCALGVGLSLTGLAITESIGLPLVLTIVGTAKGLGESVSGTIKDTNTAIAGDQVDVIMQAMHDAIHQLDLDIDQAETGLHSQLTTDLDNMDTIYRSADNRRIFEGIHPKLVDHKPSSGEFYHVP